MDAPFLLGELRQQAWDLVLLDWGLPDLSGLEVCERLRAQLRREVKRDGAVVELSVREFDLLAFLIRVPEQVHSRQAILDVYVGYLRRKIERPGLP